MSDHDVRPNSRTWRVLTQICRTFDQQYSRIHVHVIVVKNGGCNTSHSKQKLRISSLFPILLKYQRKICQPSGFSNSRKLNFFYLLFIHVHSRISLTDSVLSVNRFFFLNRR
jgi:hypothetical protein